MNPKTCRIEIGHSSFSQPNPKLIIQIDNVLHVSVKLRAVALTCLVTLSPKKLKSEILTAIAMPEYKTVGVLIIWYHPRGRSKKGVRDEIDWMERTGTKSNMVMTPKSPS